MAGVLISNLASAQDQLKSWYVDLGLGYAGASYSSNAAIQTYVDLLKSTGATNVPLSVEISFYWPVNKQFLLGVADTGFADSYSLSSASSSNSAGVVASNILASLQYFPFTEDASGLFVRADGGFGVVGTTTGFSFFPNNSSTGLALHGGVGYAIPISGTRLPVLAGYYYEGVSGGAISAYQVALSVMW